MNFISLAAGSALVAATLDAQSAQPIATYPFTLEDDHVVIDASINGRPGRFVLDSGSRAAAIASSFADGLNLNLSDMPAATSGAGEGAAQARMGTASEVTIGPLALANVRVVVLSGNPFKGLGRALDGTLGYEVFAKWTVTIDFANQTLAFFEPSTWVPSEGGVNIPVDVSKRIPLRTWRSRRLKTRHRSPRKSWSIPALQPLRSCFPPDSPLARAWLTFKSAARLC